MRTRRHWLTSTAIALVALTVLFPAGNIGAQDAQESSGSGFELGVGLGFGVTGFEDRKTNEILTFQSIGLHPDLAIGKFGIGLDLTVNYRFTAGTSQNEFEVRRQDWIPDDQTSFVELYLPKFRYARYGRKGEALFVRFGSFSDGTLGNGFIVSNYSNELFLPHRRIFGGNLDIDGRSLGVPVVGFETLVNNVAAFDLLAARLYFRPLVNLGLPILSNLQVGATAAVDRDPFYFAVRDPQSRFIGSLYTGAATVLPVPAQPAAGMWGVDTRLPILSAELLSLAAFADLAFQKEHLGAMVGAGGRAARIIGYGAQIRYVGERFQPAYFDSTYDRRRLERFAVYTGTDPVTGAAVSSPAYVGWLGNLGLILLQELLLFDLTMSGPIGAGSQAYPELRGRFAVREGVIPGFAGLSLDAHYTKFNLKTAGDLWSAENAMIGARVNVRSGPVVISLVYDLTYDPLVGPGQDRWRVSSRLESTIALR